MVRAEAEALPTPESAEYILQSDDPTPKIREDHPSKHAWWGSKLLVSWVEDMMKKGHDKQLDLEDVWSLQEHRQAAHMSERVHRDFGETKSLLQCFVLSFGWRLLAIGALRLFQLAESLLGPIVLNHVVSSLTSDHFSMLSTGLWVVLLFLVQSASAIFGSLAMFREQMISMEFTASLKSLMYTKTLRLSAQSRQQKAAGEITNLFTFDCEMIHYGVGALNQVWIMPTQIVVASYLLYQQLGVAAFAAIGVIVVMLVINQFVSKSMIHADHQYRGLRDDRMKKVTEMFKGISIVKFNAWEDKFMERIQALRIVELRGALKFLLLMSASIVLMWGLPAFICVISFGVYVFVLHRALTPTLVFTSIALFQLLQLPLRYITYVTTDIVHLAVSLKRIQSFLDMSEIDPTNVQTNQDEACAKKYADQYVVIGIENASFGWDQDSTQLHDINLHIHRGAFVVVQGVVGCGKSSLCSALLGEMVKHSGSVYVGDTVAYCSQQPWIQNLTLRDNVLFGKPYDAKKYAQILDACALTKDVKSLPAGDLTEIGERGINLSGGQKARVALARACYSDANIYILDAVLSAVDAIVQNEIFNKCVLGLLKNKTIVLVTHNPEIIVSPHVSNVVSMAAEGSVVTILSCVAPAEKTYQQDAQKDSLGEVSTLPRTEVSHQNGNETQQVLMSETLRSEGYEDTSVDEATRAAGALIIEEEREEGRVRGQVFLSYYRAVGGISVVGSIVMSQVLWQTFQVSSDLWLSSWSNDAPQDTNNNTASEFYRLWVYTGFGVGIVSMVLARTLLVVFGQLKAARHLFNRMTNSLIHAPMRFYDTNPIGRILTRYGSDVSMVDSQLGITYGSLCASGFTALASVLTAAVVIHWRGLCLIPLVYLYYLVGKFYIFPSRDLQRLEMTSQAPVITHLSESIDGNLVVRAFGASTVTRFTDLNYKKLDDNNKVTYAQYRIQQWFSTRTQLLCSAIVFIVAGSLVLFHGSINASVAGLAFSYILKAAFNLEQIVQHLAEIENQMVSPERIQQYIDIEQEPPHRILDADPPKESAWPQNGIIQFEHVDFRYKQDDPLVLRDVTFDVQSREKIGIVGRTGAGKSSLTMALFRINELAGGSIIIDGVDISTIGLQTLHEALSIIPQNPTLFKGPLRSYLDPFNDATDEQLWSSIRRVEMFDRITSEDLKLDCPVEENGENFSVGERQMLCMARALLRETRIVIFDEATAAIDHDTDQLLQRVIREAFADSTVLTIAHRLDTVLDSDRILVLDAGRVLEFASPKELIAKGSGHFYDLMAEGGYLPIVQHED